MLKSEELLRMSLMEIEHINKDCLVDIKNTEIDTLLPFDKRMLTYLEQIKNPYCFLCGNTSVKLRFHTGGLTLDETVKKHFKNHTDN